LLEQTHFNEKNKNINDFKKKQHNKIKIISNANEVKKEFSYVFKRNNEKELQEIIRKSFHKISSFDNNFSVFLILNMNENKIFEKKNMKKSETKRNAEKIDNNININYF